jgi:RNA polymerase sigma-70 factor (ECF subfamily)
LAKAACYNGTLTIVIMMQLFLSLCIIDLSAFIVVKESELLYTIRMEPEKFSEIFHLYYKPIFGYILRRTANVDDTADIAANTFLKAYAHIDQFNYKGISIKVWLYRIATNEVNMYFRSNKKKNALFEHADDKNIALFKDYLQQDKETLETELHKHEQFLSVLKALKTLPDKYQNVIALKFFEGKDNKEIASILNLNEGTLKSLLSRGLEKLRKKCNHF